MLATVWIHPSDSAYPPVLSSFLDNDASPRIAVLGDLTILDQKSLALFCSVKCPGNLILHTYDLAQRLRQSGVTVIGGFHSPMEQECLTILLRGMQPVIVCPARSLSGMRIPAAYKQPLEQGRMLLLSPFADKERRATVETAVLGTALSPQLPARSSWPMRNPGAKPSSSAARCLNGISRSIHWPKTRTNPCSRWALNRCVLTMRLCYSDKMYRGSEAIILSKLVPACLKWGAGIQLRKLTPTPIGELDSVSSTE